MSSSPSPSSSVESFGADAAQQPANPGHRGNLTPQQNAILLRLWYRFLHLCNTVPDPQSADQQQQQQAPVAYPFIPDNEPRHRGGDGDVGDDAPVPVSDTEPSDSPVQRMTEPAASAPDGQLYTHAHHQFTSTDDWDPNGPMNHRNAYLVDSREGSIISSVAPSGDKLPGVLGAPLHHLHPHAQGSTANLHQYGHNGQLSAAAAAHLKAQKRLQQRAKEGAAATAKKPSRPHLPGSHIPRDDRVKDELRNLDEAKEMKRFLETYGGAKLKEVFWQMVKGEHPDAILLRILRARKWNVDRALNVLGSTAYFRVTNRVAELVKEGELGLIKTKGGAKVLRNGISYVRGATKTGEPVYFIDVGSHFSSNQTQEELKRYIIISHETVMQLVSAPTERCVVVFNMNRFGLRNMDWWCVFFLVKTVEAYYPESLMRVYVHAYPFIFRPIWYILRPLLDPVVRDKVRLTTHVEELEELIPRHHLPKLAMHGDLDWDFEYPEPDEHENDLQLDVARTEELQSAYDRLAAEFERATSMLIEMSVRARLRRRGGEGRGAAYSRVAQEAGLAGDYAYGGWGERKGDAGSMYEDSIVDVDTRSLHSEWAASKGARTLLPGAGPSGGLPEALPSSIATLRAQRDVLASRLRVAWLELRPYVTGISKYDRWGVTSREGTIHWEYVDTDGRREEQVLGEGISLSALKRGLSFIEQAKEAGRERERERGRHRSEASAGAGASMSAPAPPQPNGSRFTHARQTSNSSNPAPPPPPPPPLPHSTLQSRKERERSRLHNLVAVAAANGNGHGHAHGHGHGNGHAKVPTTHSSARDEESAGEIDDEEEVEEVDDDAEEEEDEGSRGDDEAEDEGKGAQAVLPSVAPLPVPKTTSARAEPVQAPPTNTDPAPLLAPTSPTSPISPVSNGGSHSRSVSPEEYEAARARLRRAADVAIAAAGASPPQRTASAIPTYPTSPRQRPAAPWGSAEGAEPLRAGGETFDLARAFAASTSIAPPAVRKEHSRTRTEGTEGTNTDSIASSSSVPPRSPVSVSVPIHPLQKQRAPETDAVVEARQNGRAV